MNDATIVSRGETVGDLRAEGDHIFLRERAVEKPGAESDPVDKLHDEKVEAVVGIEVVNRGDVGMIELGESQGFVAKFSAGAIVGNGAGKENLEGNYTVEVFILGAVNDTHPAAADSLDDSVVAQGPADEWVVTECIGGHGEESFLLALCGES